jgi:rubrerythrin
MTSEQDKTLEALKTAIQMEIDGKKYYLKASKESGNTLGRKLLEKLAREEDNHRQKFEQIYEAIRKKKAWPAIDFQPNGSQNLRTLFAEASEKIGSKVKAPTTELNAVQTAMDMENKTYDFYKRHGEKATHDTEKDFYHAVAAEEREHHLILLDYYEYLKDPAGWFVKTEHPSLDGG